MKQSSTRVLIVTAFGIAINIVLGYVVGMLNIPFLFLDTIGTFFVAVLFGPWWGLTAGLLTNVILQLISGGTFIFFAIVNAMIGLIVGFIARRYDFRRITVATITGLFIAIVAPLVGTPIAVWLFKGLTGTGLDFLIVWLQTTGNDIFASTFLVKLGNNLVDKIATALIVWALVRSLPQTMLGYKGDGRQYEAK